MSAETLHVPLGKQAYDIIIGQGLLVNTAKWLQLVLPSSRAVVIADAAIADAYAQPVLHSLQDNGVKCELITLDGGEQSKGFPAYEKLMNDLLALQPDRKTTLIAVGGGVIGDLVGFAASTLLRGVPLIQIPTTLLSQVDSSVGGKTGINTAFGKNLIGSFYQPKRVIIDIDTLHSLPKRELLAGYAEIVKYAALGDDGFMSWLEENGEKLLSLNWLSLMHAIKQCLSMKAEIVEWDAHEQNMRALLNLGHTFGHALEAEAGYDGRLLHGEGVSIGMVMAAKLSADLGMCDASVEQRLAAHLKRHDMPTKPADIAGVDWNADAICSHFGQDKKAHNGNLAFVLLRAMGEAELVRDVPAKAARKVVEHFLA